MNEKQQQQQPKKLLEIKWISAQPATNKLMTFHFIPWYHTFIYFLCIVLYNTYYYSHIYSYFANAPIINNYLQQKKGTKNT